MLTGLSVFMSALVRPVLLFSFLHKGGPREVEYLAKVTVPGSLRSEIKWHGFKGSLP